MKVRTSESERVKRTARRTLHLRPPRITRLPRLREPLHAPPPILKRDALRIRVPQVHDPREHIRLVRLYELDGLPDPREELGVPALVARACLVRERGLGGERGEGGEEHVFLRFP